MDLYSQNVLRLFESPDNMHYLADAVSRLGVQSDPAASISSFAGVIRSEMYMSDPLPGVSVEDQVAYYNRRFINDHVSEQIGRTNVRFMLSDGANPLPCGGVNDYNQGNPDELLARWSQNISRPRVCREDIQGSAVCHDSVSMEYYDDVDPPSEQKLDSGRFNMLNNSRPNHTDVPFGVSTPESDARLNSRRLFRKEGYYRRNANKRWYDRDTSETFTGVERVQAPRRHDMDELYHEIYLKQKNRMANAGQHLWN